VNNASGDRAAERHAAAVASTFATCNTTGIAAQHGRRNSSDPLGLCGCSDRLALCCLHSQPFVFTKPYYVCAVLDRVVAGRHPFSVGGAGPVEVPAPLSIMHRRLVLSSVVPAAAAVLSHSALIGPPVNPVWSVSLAFGPIAPPTSAAPACAASSPGGRVGDVCNRLVGWLP
jgi:hypothetical protein